MNKFWWTQIKIIRTIFYVIDAFPLEYNWIIKLWKFKLIEISLKIRIKDITLPLLYFLIYLLHFLLVFKKLIHKSILKGSQNLSL